MLPRGCWPLRNEVDRPMWHWIQILLKAPLQRSTHTPLYTKKRTNACLRTTVLALDYWSRLKHWMRYGTPHLSWCRCRTSANPDWRRVALFVLLMGRLIKTLCSVLFHLCPLWFLLWYVKFHEKREKKIFLKKLILENLKLISSLESSSTFMSPI